MSDIGKCLSYTNICDRQCQYLCLLKTKVQVDKYWGRQLSQAYKLQVDKLWVDNC